MEANDLQFDPQGERGALRTAQASFEAKVASVTYNGGLIGLFTSRHLRLQETIQIYNDKGWRLRHVLPGRTGMLTWMIQCFCLLFTLMLWAPEPGETLVFERAAR